MSGRRLVLWRHGRTRWNLERRAQGQTDVDLDEVGVAQARDAALRLASLRPSLIWSSDLTRARRTAQALADLTGLAVHPDARLREIHLGEREGRTVEEVARLWPEVWQAWRDGRRAPPPAGGESEDDVAERAASALHDAGTLLQPGETGVVVSHGVALRCGLWHVLGLPVELSRSLGGMSNCAWSVLEQTRLGDWQLREHNAGTLPEPVLSDDYAGGDYSADEEVAERTG